MSVTQTASSNPIIVSRRLTYTVVVSNGGLNTATGISFTDVLPASATLNSVKATQGVCSGAGTVTCPLGSLSSGAKITVTIIVTPNAVGTIMNTASVTGIEGDPVSANNTSALSTTVSPK